MIIAQSLITCLKKFIGLDYSDIKSFNFTAIVKTKYVFQNCWLLMISYTLRREQELNDSKDWRAIQFFYQEIVHKKDKELWKNHVDFFILAYHWELKMTGLWISAEIHLLRYSIFYDRLFIFTPLFCRPWLTGSLSKKSWTFDLNL